MSIDLSYEKSAQLFAHQLAGIDFLLAHEHALLADEMGLGKTAQVICAANVLGRTENRRLDVLVVCPAIAKATWRREVELWSRGEEYPAHFRIESFDFAMRYPDQLIADKRDILVVDESHYLKSVTAKRSKSILGKGGIVHSVQRTWLLSGTPAPNHAAELWPFLFVFKVTDLGYWGFVQRYCATIETGYGTKIVGTKSSAVQELRQMLGQIMLRRRKEDVLKDLPPIFYSLTSVEGGFVDVTEEFAALADEHDLLESAFSDEEKLEFLLGMARSVSTLRRYNGLRKVAPAVDLVAKELALELYKKVVIFAIHKEVVARVAQGLREAGFKVVEVTGETPLAERERNVQSFQSEGGAQIFVGNIQAAGTNITLSSAHQVVFVEQDWVPGNNAQAAARCHRISQTKPVSVRFLSLEDDQLDARVTEILKRKTQELADVFSDPTPTPVTNGISSLRPLNQPITDFDDSRNLH